MVRTQAECIKQTVVSGENVKVAAIHIGETSFSNRNIFMHFE